MFLYYLVVPLIYLAARLPFSLLYLFSGFLRFFLVHITGYRREVVRQNLLMAFPGKSREELKRIEKEFYRFFCDLLVESLKTLTIGRDEALRRCRFSDRSLFDRFAAEKRSVIIVMGHYGNWEWGGNALALTSPCPVNVIYKPLANKKFNELITRMRSRFGAHPVPSGLVFREMLAMKNSLHVTAFIADQTPSPANAYWLHFLNQDTPVFTGTEKIARKLNQPVVYACVKREKRGFYRIDLELLCENPKDTREGEITEMHTKRLERDILENPAFWLWSHRRWKHSRPPV